MTDKDTKDRFEGTLLGLAVGDALGAPIEFMAADQIKKTYGILKEMVGGGRFNMLPGEYTDDTYMMLCVAESLISKCHHDPKDVAARFVQWYDTRPKGMGKTTRLALRRIKEDIPWYEAGEKDRPSNGSVMRCAPIGLLFAFDEASLIITSIENSIITHNHRDAATCCVLINLLIAGLVQHGERTVVYRETLEKTRTLNELLIETYFDKPYDPDPAWGSAINTTILAVNSFLKANSFEEAVVNAVNLGGDADTTGAVTGALAGAYWGVSEIPERWYSKLNPYSARQIRILGEGLFNLAINLK